MKAKDDRGRVVRLERLPIAAVREVDRPPLRVDPRQLERSSLAERKSFRWWMLINLILFAAFLFAFGPLGGYEVFLLFLAAMIGNAWLLARNIERIRLIHHMLARPICPSCGHDLRGLPVHDDGCSVCPECGAAWRMPEATNG